jgi:hypothetical protein
MAKGWIWRRTKEPGEPSGSEPAHSQNDETADDSIAHCYPDTPYGPRADDARKTLFSPRAPAKDQQANYPFTVSPKNGRLRKNADRLGRSGRVDLSFIGRFPRKTIYNQ